MISCPIPCRPGSPTTASTTNISVRAARPSSKSISSALCWAARRSCGTPASGKRGRPMSLRGKAAIVGIGETPSDRLGAKAGEARKCTAEYLSWAVRLALEDAGLTKKDFDGQGFAAIYTANHSQPFWPEEAAAILGISPAVSLAGGNGGASAVSLLGHAAAMINAGVVDLVLVVAAAAPFSEHGRTRAEPM